MRVIMECEICNMDFINARTLSYHLKREHNVTGCDYIEKYIPKNNCLVCGKETKVLAYIPNKYCSRVCSGISRRGRIPSKQELINQKIGMKKKSEYWKIHGHPAKGISWEKRLGKEKANKQKQNFIKGVKKGHRNGKYLHNYGANMRRIEYKGVLLRSTWELTFAKLLDSLGYSWIYEPGFVKLSNGKRYMPDFVVEEPNGIWYFVEVKGVWDKRSIEKCKLFYKKCLKVYNGMEVFKILCPQDYKEKFIKENILILTNPKEVDELW